MITIIRDLHNSSSLNSQRSCELQLAMMMMMMIPHWYIRWRTWINLILEASSAPAAVSTSHWLESGIPGV